MKKGQLYEGTIETIEFPNKGILTYKEEDREYKVVIKGTLPGQKVRFQLSKKHSGKCEGRLVEVLEPSGLEDREPLCPHYAVCGGCSYQNMNYETQLKLKGDMVKHIIDQVCSDYEYEGILGSPMEVGYRNKMEFSFGDEHKDGPLALGLHKKGSFYDIVTVDECQIVQSDYNMILRIVLDFFKDRDIPYYHKMRHSGYLRHLVVRRAIKTGEILIHLVTTSTYAECGESKKISEEELLGQLKEKLLAADYFGSVAGILHTYNDSLADVVQSDRTDVLYGRDYITEKILGLEFKISAFSFFQTNSLGAEVLYSKAREYVGETKDKVVFDLYSGTGTIAQMLAAVAKKVIGVEIVEEAVEAAKQNAALNGLENCEFIAGDVLKVIDEIEEKPDLIVLDPPRDGIHPKALEKIIDFGVDKMVYISCKPTSLARDLVILQERGYKVDRVCAIDQFPMTVHVETVCLLGREIVNDKNVEYAHVDYEPKDAEYLQSAKGSASYREIKEWIKEQHDVSVSNLYIAQVKDKLGFEKRENYNKGADGHRVPNCPAEKEKLILEAFKHFRMI